MRIAVLGANGFIGRRILQRLAGLGAHTLLGVSRQPDLLPSSGYRFEQVDLCQREAVEELLDRFRPEVVFNTVAMSSVDFCQQHPAEAYAINVEASGSQGIISMMVGIDTDGAVTGVSIVTNAETSGIGSKVMGNEPLANGTGVLDQFIGKSAADGTLAVGTNVDAITGATVSSKGVTTGVNTALAAAGAIG